MHYYVSFGFERIRYSLIYKESINLNIGLLLAVVFETNWRVCCSDVKLMNSFLKALLIMFCSFIVNVVG